MKKKYIFFVVVFIVNFFNVSFLNARILSPEKVVVGRPKFNKNTAGTYYLTFGFGTNLYDAMVDTANLGLDSTVVSAIRNNYSGSFPSTIQTTAYPRLGIGYIPSKFGFMRHQLDIAIKMINSDINYSNYTTASPLKIGTKNYSSVKLSYSTILVGYSMMFHVEIPSTTISLFVGGGIGLNFINNVITATEVITNTTNNTVTESGSVNLTSNGPKVGLYYKATAGLFFNITSGFGAELGVAYVFFQAPFGAVNQAGLVALEHLIELHGSLVLKF